MAAPGVLQNDSDAEGDTLTTAEISAPDNGTLALNADGSFTYLPNAGFTGDDSFTYVANDGTADSNVATVTITVNAVNGTPFATCGGYDVFETAPGVYAAPSFAGNLMVGDDSYNWLQGTDGPDLILGLGGPDDLWGRDGDDVLCGGEGVDIILGQRGNDTLYGDDQPDWLIGGPDNDTLYGGDGWDDLQGDGGNDLLYGEGGSNVLLGGAADDDLFGGDEPDALFGQDGNDDLDGAGADDLCKGGRGNDTITNCEGASTADATVADEAAIDEDAARRSNDGPNGENAIEQRIQQLFLPLITNKAALTAQTVAESQPASVAAASAPMALETAGTDLLQDEAVPAPQSFLPLVVGTD
ncbi:MAG: Ig-like domain-containing protein [Caldilineaceae bacterium]